MPARRPPELGRLITVYRPRHPLGWLILAVLPVPFAVFAAVADPGPLIGLGILFGLGIPWVYGLSEWFLLQHRVHEHGIVVRTDLPWTYTYVVPFYTVDPDAIFVRERLRIPRGALRAAPRQQRENPLLPEALVLDGLCPSLARKLAKGTLTWADTGPSVVEMPGSRAEVPASTVVWRMSVRHPKRSREQLVEIVRASHRTYPYQQPIRPRGAGE